MTCSLWTSFSPSAKWSKEKHFLYRTVRRIKWVNTWKALLLLLFMCMHSPSQKGHVVSCLWAQKLEMIMTEMGRVNGGQCNSLCTCSGMEPQDIGRGRLGCKLLVTERVCGLVSVLVALSVLTVILWWNYELPHFTMEGMSLKVKQLSQGQLLTVSVQRKPWVFIQKSVMTEDCNIGPAWERGGGAVFPG